jgi:hypothetical protein
MTEILPNQRLSSDIYIGGIPIFPFAVEKCHLPITAEHGSSYMELAPPSVQKEYLKMIKARMLAKRDKSLKPRWLRIPIMQIFISSTVLTIRCMDGGVVIGMGRRI